MDKVREAGAAETRMKQMETLLKVDGEVVRREPAIALASPRSVGGFKKRPFRIELYGIKYEVRGMILFTTFHDLLGACSTTRILVPSFTPTSVLVTNVSPLIPKE